MKGSGPVLNIRVFSGYNRMTNHIRANCIPTLGAFVTLPPFVKFCAKKSTKNDRSVTGAIGAALSQQGQRADAKPSQRLMSNRAGIMKQLGAVEGVILGRSAFGLSHDLRPATAGGPAPGPPGYFHEEETGEFHQAQPALIAQVLSARRNLMPQTERQRSKRMSGVAFARGCWRKIRTPGITSAVVIRLKDQKGLR